MIHKGASRWVLLIHKYAVKLPSFYSFRHFLLGMIGNMDEAKYFRCGAFPSDKLCPVLFKATCGLCIIMRRAEPITDKQWLSLNYERFRRFDEGVIPVENKRSSFGIVNDRIVAIDYA